MTNTDLKRAIDSYERVERNYVDALRAKGLVFAEHGSSDARCAEFREKLRERGAQFRNAGASIVMGWLSKACVACTGKNGSETFSTTFKCHRNCYFCFNYNLADYDKFVSDDIRWEDVLAGSAQANKGKLDAVGLTGGEPLLKLEDSLAFLEKANKTFPGAHMRMYTSGDLLTEQGAARLRDAGLDEMRFSVKQDDSDELRETVLKKMELARRYINDVVVEMPIIPGTGKSMRAWMRRFADIGIRGMNLLEFCFPFHSWDEFARRGFTLRNPPFPIMYDYSYSGGLAIAGSEELALELMLWAADEKLGFGMHYCSLENKHRSELRQMNERAGDLGPCVTFDEDDFFLKSARVFGSECALARAIMEAIDCKDIMEDKEEGSLTFAPVYGPALLEAGLCVMSVFYVLEKDEQGKYLREVGLKPYGTKSI